MRHPQGDAGARNARDDLVETDCAEECHDVSVVAVQAARRNRLSAIAAVLARPLPGPSAAIAGLARLIKARPAARALAMVTASTLLTISSSGIGRPYASICLASWPTRASELSSAIKSPAFIWALARL